MTLRAYANRRNVRLAAVQKAIASGRVKGDALRKDARGRNVAIEAHRANKQWRENTDPVEAAKSGKTLAPVIEHHTHQRPEGESTGGPAPQIQGSAPSETGETGEQRAGTAAAGQELELGLDQDPRASAPAPAVNDQAADSYLNSRARKEHFNAQQAELEYLRAIGQLVPAADVDREMSEVLTQLKSNVFGIADRKAQILSAEADPARVIKILTEEFRTVFDECSRRFAADAAEGIEERAPVSP